MDPGGAARPMPSTNAAATPLSSVNRVRSTKKTPAGNLPIARPAASIAARVFPIPPGPTTVTSRWSATAASIRSTWACRPISVVRCAGSVDSCRPIDRNGGNSDGSPSATTW